MKYIFLTVALTAIVCFGLTLQWQSFDSPRPPRRDRPRAPSAGSIYAVGRIEGVSRDIELYPEMVGRVVRVAVKEGDDVRQGQLLLQIDQARSLADLALAHAELEAAKSQLQRLRAGARQEELEQAAALAAAKRAQWQQAQRTWDRFERLRKNDTVTGQETEDAFSRLQSLHAEFRAADASLDLLAADPRPEDIEIEDAKIAAADARLELARVRLAQTELRAPAAGRVMQVGVQVGELAGPDMAEAAVMLADVRHLHVRAFVEELDAPRILEGMAATITAEGLPGQVFAGRVVQLSPRMDPKRLTGDRPDETYDTKVREVCIELSEVPAADRQKLVIGLRVDVRIAPEVPRDTSRPELAKSVKSGVGARAPATN